MPGLAEIKRAQELLEVIFNNTIFYYGTEGLQPDSLGPLPRLEQLRFDTIKEELLVRSPTYYSHWADILAELFGSESIADWMRRELGFDIHEVLRCVQAMSDLTTKKINERFEKAAQFGRSLKNTQRSFENG